MEPTHRRFKQARTVNYLDSNSCEEGMKNCKCIQASISLIKVRGMHFDSTFGGCFHQKNENNFRRLKIHFFLKKVGT